MHQRPYVADYRSQVVQSIWCFIGFILAIAGGVLGYYVVPLLFTLMPMGATLCAGLCWRLTRV